MTQPTASHFINGEYVEDTNGAPIDVIDPETGAIIARGYSATSDISEHAVNSALNAQKAWARLSGTERGRVLQRALERTKWRGLRGNALDAPGCDSHWC